METGENVRNSFMFRNVLDFSTLQYFTNLLQSSVRFIFIN